MFLFAGLLFYGPLNPLQEECGDGWPCPAVWGFWKARLSCGGPQRHDEGKTNGLGSPSTNTLKLMDAVTDRWEFFLPFHSTWTLFFFCASFTALTFRFRLNPVYLMAFVREYTCVSLQHNAFWKGSSALLFVRSVSLKLSHQHPGKLSCFANLSIFYLLWD